MGVTVQFNPIDLKIISGKKLYANNYKNCEMIPV